MKPKNLSDAEQMWNLLVESKNQPVEETTHRDDKKDALGPGEHVCPKTGNILDKDGNVVHKSGEKKVEEASKPDYIDADGDGDKKESMKKAFKDKEEEDDEEVEEAMNVKEDDLTESEKERLKKDAEKKKGEEHDCAKKVQHEQFGLGECVHGAHGVPINGHVNWYTVVFEHGTEVVDTEDLIILASESHEH